MDTVLFALDVTEPVIDLAVSLGAQLIVTHHPLLFSPVHTLTEDDYDSRLVRRLVREGISLIAAHTNLDKAPGGINDTLAALCGLRDITGDGFFRCGTLPADRSAYAYADELKTLLRTDVRLMGPGNTVIRKVGLCSGGGSDEWIRAAESGIITRSPWQTWESWGWNAGILRPRNRAYAHWLQLYKMYSIR